MNNLIRGLDAKVCKAVTAYWQTRQRQTQKQKTGKKSDQGARSAVTGGAQMDGFVDLMSELIVKAGIHKEYIFRNAKLELPGFFRPTKEWDLLVVRDGQLLAALEFKSQVGPSFGNNFNNRTEEAMGSALDLWTAYRENAFNSIVKPWLGYLFLLEECDSSKKPISVKEPHFPVFPEFKNASYAVRYELFCRKLLRERHYSSTTFLLSKQKEGLRGKYSEPAYDLAFEQFVRSLGGHLISLGGTKS